MKRLASVLSPFVLVLAVGCAGDTDPASNVTNVSAQLNAHGRTTGEPATWWWEYATNQAHLGTANDTEVCGAGTGPNEPDFRCGPASWENRGDISLNVVVTGLAPNTTYHFRACGKKQSWAQGACGAIKSFTTLAGTSYTFDRAIGASGNPPSGLNAPFGLLIEPSGNLQVVSAGSEYVVKFSPTGAFISSFGSGGTGDGEFIGPQDIERDPAGNLYVLSDTRVQKFSASGQFISKFTLALGERNASAFGLTRDQNGNFYVSFSGVFPASSWIQKYSSAGTFITEWGSFGTADGQFQSPDGMDVDAAGNLYVADVFNDRIQKFSPTGTFLAKFGTTGTGNGQLDAPFDVHIDAQGNMLIADTDNLRIQKWGPNGTFITAFAAPGGPVTNSFVPGDVTTDAQGNVYASDFPNDRVAKFKPTQ